MTYEYHLRHIQIRDLIRISSDGDNQTNNNSILYRILSQTLDAFPTTWAATEAKDSYLFHINYRMREEWQNTLFYFYCCGRMNRPRFCRHFSVRQLVPPLKLYRRQPLVATVSPDRVVKHLDVIKNIGLGLFAS